jgi:hypothetical protein
MMSLRNDFVYMAIVSAQYQLAFASIANNIVASRCLHRQGLLNQFLLPPLISSLTLVQLNIEMAMSNLIVKVARDTGTHFLPSITVVIG